MTKEKIPQWRIDNTYPIVVSFITMIIAVTGSYWGLSNKIDLLNQKLDYYIEATNTNKSSIHELQILHNDLEVKIAKCCPTTNGYGK